MDNLTTDLMDAIGIGSARRNREFEASQALQQMEYQTNSAREAMNFEASEAEKLRQWETEMSNTAVKRRVKDLKEAGINPILAAGQSASTPTGASGSGHSASGAMASGDGSGVGSVLGFVSNIMSSAAKISKYS